MCTTISQINNTTGKKSQVHIVPDTDDDDPLIEEITPLIRSTPRVNLEPGELYQPDNPFSLF